MNRRQFLELATFGGLVSAGCSEASRTPTGRPTATTSPTPTQTGTTTETTSDTETPRENPDTIFVGPDGASVDPGTVEQPVGTFQEALERAEPGETVHALPGRYIEQVETVRSGRPDAPIEITGPPDAVFHSGNETGTRWPLRIRHSHVHVTGLTFDGLQDPDNPDDLDSYALANIAIIPPIPDEGPPKTLENLKLMPHAVGNTYGNCLHIFSSDGVEVGEFPVIGPAGLRYKLQDREGHFGEILYIGTGLGGWDAKWNGYPDKVRNVHVHHIDNSAGYHHSELVDCKAATSNILIEYCTDGGGSQNTEPGAQESISIQGHNITLRYCKLQNGLGYGVEVRNARTREAREENDVSDLEEWERRGGRDNEIYGNVVTGFDDKAFHFPFADSGQSPDAQRYFCGNTYTGPTDGEPDAQCPDEVPEGDGVGHLGGDSPWSA